MATIKRVTPQRPGRAGLIEAQSFDLKSELGKYVKGDLASRREQTIGPFEIYLPTGRKNPDGTLVMEDVQDDNETWVKISEREPEPFLTEVYFRKIKWTLNSEQTYNNYAKEMANNGDFILSAAVYLATVLKAWDLVNDGLPVPVTVEGMNEHDVDADIIMSCINKYNEVTAIKKASSEKSLPTPSVEE